jgi:hypothetical protein
LYTLIRLQSKVLGAMYSRAFAVIVGAVAVAALVYSYYKGSVAIDALGAVLIGFLVGVAIITRLWTREWC